MPSRPATATIQRFILEQAAKGADAIAAATAIHFRITRQAANRHIRGLVQKGLLEAQGRTRGRRYALAKARKVSVIPVGTDLDEHVVWQKHALPHLEGIPDNVLYICNYGLTEMVNNVKDHSGSPDVAIVVQRTAVDIEMRVKDRGIGIFQKIKEAYSLENEREAILELVKGKLTTDPTHHTGEGIFFTSRMFDRFSILSGRLCLNHSRDQDDWLLDDEHAATDGTLVSMAIDADSRHNAADVFDHYASQQDDYAFRKTHIGLDLAQNPGETLVSRSQAKRLLYRLDRFREVVLDFKNVETIGPAFADEAFRVFRLEHPDTDLIAVNTNDEVAKMIRRAQADLPRRP